MATKELAVKVKINTANAHRSLDKLASKIKSINGLVNKNTNSKGLEKQLERALLKQEKLKQATAKTQLAESKVTAQIHKTNKAKNDALISEERLIQAKNRTALTEQKLVAATEKAKHSTNSLLLAVKKLAKTYLGIQTLKLAITASDTVTAAQNKLNNIDGGNPKQTAESMDKMYAAAQRARTGYDAMMSNVSKTMMLAGDSFGGNIDNAIRFQEIMAKAYTVGGATAQEQHTSMYQLVQALGSGILAGDELRSVREGAPIAYKEIEKFAQGVYGASDSLKDMASEGKITSDIIVAAIMNAGDKIEEKFNNTKVTFAQAWTSIKNTAMKAFQPALESMNKMLNSDAGKATVETISKIMIIVGKVLEWVIGLLSTIVNWLHAIVSWVCSIATSTETAGKIIFNILAVIGIALAVILFPKFIAWLQYIAWVAMYYIWLGATALASGIKAMIGWMAANWVLLLIIVIIAAVVTAVIWLSDSIADACGMIVGGIMAAVAFVWNLFLALVDLILGIVSAIWNGWMSFANFFANVFKDPIGSIIHLFGDMADYVLGIVETIASAIDKVFGSNLADAVSGWRGSLDAKITQAAEKHGNGKYEEKFDKVKLTSESLGLSRWGYSDAYNTGYGWGKAGAEWLGNVLSGNGLPNSNDLNYSMGDSMGKLGNIDDNTKKIKDSMDLTNDDLDYLRKIAEMEWRKEFTTAEIKVDMTNHNSITSERDWEGMLEYLSDTLKEEMNEVAYGVHY